MKQLQGEIRKYPMLPMRDIVVFPHMTTPFFIGRKQSIEALESALSGDRKIFVVAQKDPMIESPAEKDIYQIGSLGQILQVMRLPNGTIKALFEAKQRARIIETDFSANSYSASIEVIEDVKNDSTELKALYNTVRSELGPYLKKAGRSADNMEIFSSAKDSPGKLADLIAPLLTINVHKKQDLIETINEKERLEKVYMRMLEEEEHKKLEKKLKDRVQGQIGKTQKEFYLNEQMKAIQKELGDDNKSDFAEYEDKIKELDMPKHAKETAEKELKKLKMMPPMSSEANIVRNYLDWLIQVPWSSETKDNFDLSHAQSVLDSDHYGLEKVKDRIIEYLAVASKVGKLKGPILCLVGPPGVGKTSIARSVAKALGRKFVRASLGGVRDEAEIRGHRRTYIGSLPGKIVQSMKKAKTNNPLMLLDEIDKMTRSHMGDPSAALLEVLDPEQNDTFMDHYLEIEYDLSNVLFFCTANSIQDIPGPLKDRMEVITLSGYTELEKEKIASNFLIPKQFKDHAISKNEIKFQKDAIHSIIIHYTKEAGVRNLEREIAKICRKSITEIIKSKNSSKKVPKSLTVTKKRVQQFLGVQRFDHGKIDENNEIGIVNGLAWTAFGGDILNIEVVLIKGSGKVQLTGKLGDVMKESAYTAWTYIKANANSYGIYSSVFKDLDVHLHVPEGATPKDGPSAGITITTAMISALTGIPVHKEVAMTGEITLRGKVLPIGGLKEKLLAAKRSGIKTAVIPSDNKKDLEEVPKEILDDIKVIPVSNPKEVIKIALERFPQPVRDEDVEENDADKLSDPGKESSVSSHRPS